MTGRPLLYAAALAIAVVFGYFLASIQHAVTGSAAASQTTPGTSVTWVGTSDAADWLLVLITSIALVAAFQSLSAIQKQVLANIDAAKVARETAAAASAAAAAAQDTAIAAKDDARAVLDLAAAAKDLAAATRDGAAAAKDAAGAAQLGAAAIQKQLHLAFRPYFDLKNAFVEPDGSDGRPLLNVGYTIYNASATPGHVFRFEWCYSMLPGSNELPTSGGCEVCDTFVPPGRGYRAPIQVELTEDAKQAYLEKTLVIEVLYQVFYTDPFGTEHRQMLRRQIRCGIEDFKRSIGPPFHAATGRMPARL